MKQDNSKYKPKNKELHHPFGASINEDKSLFDRDGKLKPIKKFENFKLEKK